MSTRVRFARQLTINDGSDHLALMVDVVLVRRGWETPLRLCTINAGGRFSLRALARIAKVWAPDVLAFQEASDQQGIAKVLEAAGYVQLTGEPGDQPGQAATPTWVKASRVTVQRPGRWVRLLGAERIGKGAGPDRSKPKWWLRTWLVVDGIRFGASSWHATASQQNRLRWLAALREARVWVAIVLNVRRPIFTLGDGNSDQQQRLARWIVRHGVTTNHQELGEVATHERRSIDSVAVPARFVL